MTNRLLFGDPTVPADRAASMSWRCRRGITALSSPPHNLHRERAAGTTSTGGPVAAQLTLSDRIDQKIFDAVYSRALVYNTCWEDPAVDRRALALRPEDSLLVITSAGCNVLDYALLGPRRIDAVDANPRQTALLELKLAGIRGLEHRDFFALFGHGRHPHFKALYRDVLRADLSPFAQAFWDARNDWFAASGGGLYFHGLSGIFARALRAYLRLRPQLGRLIDGLFECASLAEQRELYEQHVAPLMWGFWMNWTLSRQVTLSMLGVPHAQRREVIAQHRNGVAGFIRESIEYLARNLPFRDNYFYAVYVRGAYTPQCCPEYLKPAQFAALKAGLAACIVPHTTTVTRFLRDHRAPVSRFVLLDHMDWMSSYDYPALIDEWQAILASASGDARILLRSAHARPRYLEQLRLGPDGQRLRELFTFHDQLASELSRQDRVHTYAGFHIADVVA